jgi:hypothetical protein
MEKQFEFWKDWKNITAQEKEAVKSLRTGERIILENIPREEILAIYVKGSFIRREMNEKSDMDTVTILKHSSMLPRLRRLGEKYKKVFDPEIQFSGYSLWELKNGKRSTAKGIKKNRAGTSRILKHFDHYQLIYGTPIDVSGFPRRSHEHDLRSMVNVFHSLFIPMYDRKELGFDDIVKQTLWVVENEMRFLGKPTPHSWKALDSSIEEKNHIIHLAYGYRLKSPKDKRLRVQYVKRLETYLNKLEKVLE